MLSAVGVLLVLTVASVSALRTPPDADLTGPAARSHATWASEVLKMRDTMHTMTREEQDRRLAEIKHFGRNLEREHQDKIDHFVVLFMENRAADYTFGCMLGEHPEFDGIPKEGLQIMKDPENATAGNVTVTCGTAPYVCKGGMGFSSNGHFKPGADSKVYPYGDEGNTWDYANGAKSEAIEMFSGDQLPIKKAVSENFAVFNKYFTSTPTASTPNHLYSQSCTSCGITANELYSSCGGPTKNFPQMTIYDNCYLNNVSFNIYYNSTCGDENRTSCETAWGGGSVYVDTPDMAMMGVARHTDHFQGQDVFYKQAAAGTLPQFSFINPPSEACDHPCHDMAKGERLLKDVYEGVRNGPKWSKTLMLVMYDDWGGTYDHVVPPTEGVPDDEAPCNVPKEPNSDISCSGFDFKRLGLRSTAMVISPWVKKASIIQEPQAGPYNTSQWEHSSASSTIKNLFNLSTFLTKRDAWAGNLEELLLDEPRTDAPEHFPEPPKVTSPWTVGPGGVPLPPGTDSTAVDAEAAEADKKGGRHCSAWMTTCQGHEEATTKQKNKIAMYAALLDIAPEDIPNHEEMSKDEANAWLAARWDEHMAASHLKVGRALFNMSITRSCKREAFQFFTTDLHIAPTDEQIYLGGLPPLPDHMHMHNPDEAIPACHAAGGCCLAAGPWDVPRQVSTVTAAACNATDLTQKWSTVGDGQLCLMHANLCLHLAADDSVVLTPFAGVDTHEEQQWEVSANSIIYRGEDRAADDEEKICLEAIHTLVSKPTEA